MADNLGYIWKFDTLEIVGSTAKANEKSVTHGGVMANVKIVKLPNGTVINYDGTADASTSYGPFEQEIAVYSSAVTLYNSLKAKLGNRGIAIKKDYPDGTTQYTNAGAVLDRVEIVSVDAPKADAMHLKLYFYTDKIWEIVGP